MRRASFRLRPSSRWSRHPSVHGRRVRPFGTATRWSSRRRISSNAPRIGASEQLRLVERFKPTSANTVEWSVRYEDASTRTSTELFAWRAFTNGRQIGACVGLTPTPYRSDQGVREQGISRIGIVALARKLLIALWRYLETNRLPEGAIVRP